MSGRSDTQAARPTPWRRVARPQEGREDVMGRQPVDDRGHALRGVVVQLLAAGRPDHVLQRRPGRPGQGIGVATPRALAIGGPEAIEQAVLDEAGQAALGDPPVAEDEERGELCRDDVAVDEPDQEAPVALGQGRPGGDPRPRSNPRPSNSRQPGPPFGSSRARLSPGGVGGETIGRVMVMAWLVLRVVMTCS